MSKEFLAGKWNVSRSLVRWTPIETFLRVLPFLEVTKPDINEKLEICFWRFWQILPCCSVTSRPPVWIRSWRRPLWKWCRSWRNGGKRCCVRFINLRRKFSLSSIICCSWLKDVLRSLVRETKLHFSSQRWKHEKPIRYYFHKTRISPGRWNAGSWRLQSIRFLHQHVGDCARERGSMLDERRSHLWPFLHDQSERRRGWRSATTVVPGGEPGNGLRTGDLVQSHLAAANAGRFGTFMPDHVERTYVVQSQTFSGWSTNVASG